MATKFFAKARAGMKSRGTEGSLRKIAQSRGLLAGKKATLTGGDLAKLRAIAFRMPEGAKRTGLMRKISFARNAMRSSHQSGHHRKAT